MDEFSFRNDVKKLKRGFIALDQMKYAKIIRGERTMKPTPGPQAPAQDWPMNTKIDLEQELHEVAADVRNRIAPAESLAYPEGHPEEGNLISGPDLCDWLYLKANPLAELDIADETVGETVRRHNAIIARHIPQEDEVATPLERWQYAAVIIQHLEKVGITGTADQLRNWAHRKNISSKQRNGKNVYLLSDVVGYLKKRRQ